jgi:hypothetical protein
MDALIIFGQDLKHQNKAEATKARPEVATNLVFVH